MKKASQTAVERCKGMDRAKLDVEGVRSPYGLEKVYRSCCSNGLNSLGIQDSINKVKNCPKKWHVWCSLVNVFSL